MCAVVECETPPRVLRFRRRSKANDGRIQVPQFSPLFPELDLQQTGPLPRVFDIARGPREEWRGQHSSQLRRTEIRQTCHPPLAQKDNAVAYRKSILLLSRNGRIPFGNPFQGPTKGIIVGEIAIFRQSLQYNPECVRRVANDVAILLSDCRRLLSHHNCRRDSDEHRIGNSRDKRYGMAKSPALSRSPSSWRSWSFRCRRNSLA